MNPSVENEQAKPISAALQAKLGFARELGLDIWLPTQLLRGTQPSQAAYQINPAQHQLKAKNQFDDGAAAQSNATAMAKLRAELGGSIGVSIPSQDTKNSSRGKDAVRSSDVAIPKSSVAVSERIDSLLQRFDVVCFFIDDKLVVDDLSGLQLAQSSYKNWINTIAFALGIKLTSLDAIKVKRLSWPIKDTVLPLGAGLSSFSSSIANAQSAIDFSHAWLLRQLSQYGGAVRRDCWLMGDVPWQLFSMSNIETPNYGDMANPDFLSGGKAVYLPSSKLMFEYPEAKRELWLNIS